MPRFGNPRRAAIRRQTSRIRQQENPFRAFVATEQRLGAVEPMDIDLGDGSNAPSQEEPMTEPNRAASVSMRQTMVSRSMTVPLGPHEEEEQLQMITRSMAARLAETHPGERVVTRSMTTRLGLHAEEDQLQVNNIADSSSEGSFSTENTVQRDSRNDDSASEERDDDDHSMFAGFARNNHIHSTIQSMGSGGSDDENEGEEGENEQVEDGNGEGEGEEIENEDYDSHMVSDPFSSSLFRDDSPWVDRKVCRCKGCYRISSVTPPIPEMDPPVGQLLWTKPRTFSRFSRRKKLSLYTNKFRERDEGIASAFIDPILLDFCDDNPRWLWGHYMHFDTICQLRNHALESWQGEDRYTDAVVPNPWDNDSGWSVVDVQIAIKTKLSDVVVAKIRAAVAEYNSRAEIRKIWEEHR